MTSKFWHVGVLCISLTVLCSPVAAQEVESGSPDLGRVAKAASPVSMGASPGMPALHRAVSAAIPVIPAGVKVIPAPPTGTWGIVASGDGGGAIFRDTDSEAEAWLGSSGFGIYGYGELAGGYFKDSGQSGEAIVGSGDYGIEASGNIAGGNFIDPDGTGQAFVAYGNVGVYSTGSQAGGYFFDAQNTGSAWLGFGTAGVVAGGDDYGGLFSDNNGSGQAHVGYGDLGIVAEGDSGGGSFSDTDSSGFAFVGYGDRGIEASGNTSGGFFSDSDGSGYAAVGISDNGIEGSGNNAGGYFRDLDGNGYGWVGSDDIGIRAYGNASGGYFEDLDGSGYARVGFADYGIQGWGNLAGGHFEDTDSTGWARVGYGDNGIWATGDTAGGVFEDTNASGYAQVALGDVGIEATGDTAGGRFIDTDGGSYAYVGYSTYKIEGTGTVSFVQNHPYDPSSVIVYAAPEGDEVATYTRGTALLNNGEARVKLGETFQWVTNPDIGLTTHLTPVGRDCGLYVAETNTDELIVRSDEDSDCTFHYLVYGLRIGFEESTIVQHKTQEARIPSMKDHRELAAHRPDLAGHTAIARWRKQELSRGLEAADIDLSRAQALKAAITEYDPAVHGPLSVRPERPEHLVQKTPEADYAEAQPVSPVNQIATPGNQSERRTESQMIPAVSDDLYARSFRPSAGDLSSLMAVGEDVEPGDVLVITDSGLAKRSDIAEAPTVLGVVAAEPGVVLGDEVGGGPNAAVAFAGTAMCKVDATFGPIYPGDLLVTSPTLGHAMRTDVPAPGTVVGKALEAHSDGAGSIRILVMLR